MTGELIAFAILLSGIAGGLICWKLGRKHLLWQQKREGHAKVEAQYKENKEKFL